MFNGTGACLSGCNETTGGMIRKLKGIPETLQALNDGHFDLEFASDRSSWYLMEY